MVDSATDTRATTTDTPGSQSGPFIPDWLINIAALGWRVLAIAGLLVVLWLLATLLWTVTASIAVGIVISAFFAPFVLRLRDQGRSRTAAAGIVWVAAILAMVGTVAVLALAFLPYVLQLVTDVETGLADLEARVASLQVPPAVMSVLHGAIEAIRSASSDALGGLVASVAEAVTVLILASFLVFFFLRDGDKAWVWAFQAIGEDKRDRITTAGDDALARVGGYLRGTTVLSLLIAATDLVFMLVLGVPLALPLAVLVFLAGFIPYFGGIVATAVILLVTLGALGPEAVVVLVLLIGVRNVILGYGVRPLVYGRTVKIHPAIVLIALPAGFELGGIIGLFAAVPVTAVLLAVANATVAIVDPDPRPSLPGLVPAWLDRVAQWSWRILVALGLIGLCAAILAAVPLVVVPLVLATILAATLEPVVHWLHGRGHSRGRAAAIAVGGSALAITVVLVVTTLSLIDQAGSIGAGATAGAESVDAALGGHLGIPADAVAGAARDMVQVIVTLGESAATIAVISILAALFSFYLLRDGGRLWSRIMARVPPDAATEVQAAGTRAAEVLGGYMFGTAAISFVGAASQLVIMVLLGIPLALPVFVLSFFLCFIPYIGGFISTGIAFLLTVALGSTVDVVIMGIWTIVFNIVTGNVVSPLVYGRTVQIHPAIVLVAIPAGGSVAGILGMFIVIPVLGVVSATWRTVVAIMGMHGTPAGGPTAPGADTTPMSPPAQTSPQPRTSL